MFDEKKDDSKVIKDMSDAYNESISNILKEIDDIKKEMVRNPWVIGDLRERFDTLYTHLTRKTSDTENTKQKEFEKVISRISFELIKKKKRLDENYEIVVIPLMRKDGFFKLRDILREREIHLHRILERVGLTAQGKKKRMV